MTELVATALIQVCKSTNKKTKKKISRKKNGVKQYLILIAKVIMANASRELKSWRKTGKE